MSTPDIHIHITCDHTASPAIDYERLAEVLSESGIRAAAANSHALNLRGDHLNREFAEPTPSAGADWNPLRGGAA